MSGMLENVRNILEQLTTGQKVRIALGVVATVGLIWGVATYATRVRYAPLFTGMDIDDASLVAAELKERNVTYKLAAGGRIVEVPASQIDQLRMELAAEGLPRGGGVGYEIFDKPSFGLSDFVQNVNYRRALERELARSVQSLDTVDTARVHLALPPETVFADEKQEASASVMIRMRGGRSLSGEHVRAITHLVASGVEGLDSGRVSVVDADGRMLTEGSDGEDGALPAGHLEAKQAMETRIENRLVTILEPIVGIGKVQATATVEVKTARVQRVEERFDPDGAVVRSEEKEKSSSQGSTGGGVPGTESNVPGGTNVGAGAGSNQESQNTRTRFEINKTVSTTAEPRGTLVRQSIAVVVDHAMKKTTDADGNETTELQPRTAEEMQQIEDLVRAAVGIDEGRGDTMNVANAPFDETLNPETELELGLDWVHLTTQILRYLTVPLAVLLIVMLVIRPGIAALRSVQPQQPKSVSDGVPPTVAELQARIAGESLPVQGSTLRRKLIEAAGQDPEAAALVVRGWLGKQAGE